METPSLSQLHVQTLLPALNLPFSHESIPQQLASLSPWSLTSLAPPESLPDHGLIPQLAHSHLTPLHPHFYYRKSHCSKLPPATCLTPAPPRASWSVLNMSDASFQSALSNFEIRCLSCWILFLCQKSILSFLSLTVLNRA